MKTSGMLCKKPFDFGHASGVCNLPREHAKSCGLIFGVMRVELTDGSFVDWMAREPDAARVGCRMNDATFRAFLDLLMRADLWPLDGYESPLQEMEAYTPLTGFADNESRARGYDGWNVAYHELKLQEADGYKLAVWGSGFTPESVVTIDGEAVKGDRVAFVSSRELRVYVSDEAAGKAVVRLAVDGARVPFGGKP